MSSACVICKRKSEGLRAPVRARAASAEPYVRRCLDGDANCYNAQDAVAASAVDERRLRKSQAAAGAATAMVGDGISISCWLQTNTIGENRPDKDIHGETVGERSIDRAGGAEMPASKLSRRPSPHRCSVHIHMRKCQQQTHQRPEQVQIAPRRVRLRRHASKFNSFPCGATG